MVTEGSLAVRCGDESDLAPVPFSTGFVRSEAFRTLFRDGMGLVESTACYLDGDGRAESNALPRAAALAYASESMRLTTRLMQIASWLLVQRAVVEGEISPAQALRERERVKLVPQDRGLAEDQFAALPERLRDLIAQSLRMHARVLHLDGLLTTRDSGRSSRISPVTQQQRLLRSIFEVA
ncbi:DUF1465 family protein [Enterovirga rhinocerotis]|uniref:Regulator of CtrA degradation n=1 Tax=Enterovirga rhinocerotis TaxID=1339210 RepID=A0A4R7BU22_9HYPH|nr:DUF1465 family protein [Enterovirga rhinocerotis]TDR89001.1 regulator of CtrA degradation [Enterovirga rhinocerotis]